MIYCKHNELWVYMYRMKGEFPSILFGQVNIIDLFHCLDNQL